MKTDVIFLGAGASVGAGFPVNRELVNYIIDKLELPSNADVLEPLIEKLRATNMLSVDEFCQKNQNTAEVVWMKRIARYALAVYPSATGKPPWDSPYNPYRDFIDTLFFRGEIFPDARFTVVNFNYDGLLAKLLTEAVSARAYNERRSALDPWRLAPFGGGYYHFPGANHIGEYDLRKAELQDTFMHLMPHGTITVLKERQELFQSDEAFVYPDTELSAYSDVWQNGLMTFPMIDFPWESDQQVSKNHRAQLHLAAQAVKQAARIHFIGLAGHYLMRGTLSRIFEALTPEELLGKQWFIATVDSDPERTFRNICNCFLPPDLLEDDAWRRLNKMEAQLCGDFKGWMYMKPHHNPVDE